MSVRSFREVRPLLDSWQHDGERLLAVYGGEAEHGCFASTIAGRRSVPHGAPRPGDPVPVRSVVEGRYRGDEWVHDPALRGWVHADSPDQLAVQCANALASAGPDGWLVMTDRRTAVVTGNGCTPDAGTEEEPAERSAGGFLGRARSMVAAVQSDLSDRFRSRDTALVTLWECPIARTARTERRPGGRNVRANLVSSERFPDGSVLELKWSGTWSP
ncbi:hypothetical protein [Saccharopolyspora rosea]|uniref:Uncharacterized protein n=1 Tax=Saccharopolyspora rosea TaxID=524884 RepID=A0ABW3FSJ4_9PSEU|nr:hypothetical protein [Saccharopolyspora rosea]